jgi:hypothetical protein
MESIGKSLHVPSEMKLIRWDSATWTPDLSQNLRKLVDVHVKMQLSEHIDVRQMHARS